jgi:hypothetical protein
MQKLKLKLEELDIESFEMGDDAPVAGTVAAHQQQVVDSEVSACTCTTGGTAFFTEGCGAETWYTAHWKAC